MSVVYQQNELLPLGLSPLHFEHTRVNLISVTELYKQWRKRLVASVVSLSFGKKKKMNTKFNNMKFVQTTVQYDSFIQWK